MPRGRPVRIVDSERRASMSLTNTIQNMLLDKTVKLLNKNERTVVHRICLNQKCVLKRHQQKVHESQMNYARIIGDKQLEDGLRRKYRDNNVTMDDMEEADDTLMRLWRRGQEDIKELRRRLAGTGRKGEPLRPRTVFADLSNRSGGDNDVTKCSVNLPIRRAGTSMSTAVATQRSSTSFSVNLPFRTTASRSSTSLSMANQNAVNIRSSTSHSISRRKSSVSVIFQNGEEKARKRPSMISIDPFPKRKECQVRLETPDPKTSKLNVENSDEIDAVEKCNCLNRSSGQGENGVLQNLNSSTEQEKGTKPDGLRPKTSLGHPTINVRIRTTKVQGQSQGHSWGEGRSSGSTDPKMRHKKSTLPVFFEDADADEKPTLLQLHKERIKSANYISRIDNVVDELKDWKIGQKNIIHDYYYIGQVGTNRCKPAGEGAAAAGQEVRRISMKPAETRRYTGDLQVKNLTFPTLELS